MSVRAFVGLGGNVGDAAATLRLALAALDALPMTRLVKASSLLQTAPVGGIAQADFINAVAELDTALPALDLLHALFAIERAHGRDRSREQRWGPRTLDLDVLIYGDEIITLDGLSVPHPRMAERRFVLAPLAEIAPDVMIPGIGRVDRVFAGLP